MIVQGQTSGSIRSDVLKMTGTVKSISLFSQNSGGAIVVNVAFLRIGSYERYFRAYNLAAKGSSGSSSYEETIIPILKGDILLLVSNGAVDYYINIDEE